jgi:hypothetical protein
MAVQDEDVVYTTFDLSLHYLEGKNTIISRDAVEILNIVSFYHFEHIRVDIFTRAVENRGKELCALPNKPLSGRLLDTISKRLQPRPVLPRFLRDDVETLHPYRVREALHELYSLSLISYDGKNASFSLHPLVHAWARDRLHRGEKQVWAQMALNTLTQAVLLPPDDAGENHGDFRRDLLPHLDECLAACPITISRFSGRLGTLRLACASRRYYLSFGTKLLMPGNAVTYTLSEVDSQTQLFTYQW